MIWTSLAITLNLIGYSLVEKKNILVWYFWGISNIIWSIHSFKIEEYVMASNSLICLYFCYKSYKTWNNEKNK